MKYSIVVSNAGTVGEWKNRKDADREYEAWILVTHWPGRLKDEDVALFRNGEPIREHFGKISLGRDE